MKYDEQRKIMIWFIDIVENCEGIADILECIVFAKERFEDDEEMASLAALAIYQRCIEMKEECAKQGVELPTVPIPHASANYIIKLQAIRMQMKLNRN